MTAIPRLRPSVAPALLSAGFRPFFLLGALWSSVAVPVWLMVFSGQREIPTVLAPALWHVHEMVFGFGAATVAGFLLTAIPNWTGRMPLQGGMLAGIVLVWTVGRVAVLLSGTLGAVSAAILDLAFPAVFAAVIAREITVGRNWRNLPMLAALGLLFAGNLLVHLEAIGVASTAAVGNRIGIATLLMLIGLVGGRIIPSFTRNWLVKQRPEVAVPAPFGRVDRAALALTALALAVWTTAPDGVLAPWASLIAGLAICARIARWRTFATLREPLLWILHLGYGWLGVGFLLLALSGFAPALPSTAALHALTAGAIGTMTVAVMTRASLGHTGRPLVAGPGTMTIYALVTTAAICRVFAPLLGAQYVLLLSIAGVSWSAAFGLFALLYFPALALPSAVGRGGR